MKYRVIARDEDGDGFLKPLLSAKVPDCAVGHELAYRSLKARLEELLSAKRQLEAELEDGPSTDRRVQLGNKINGINAQLGALRVLVRDAGELSYATVYKRVADQLLSKETRMLIDGHVRYLMERAAHEVKGSSKGADHLIGARRVRDMVTA